MGWRRIVTQASFLLVCSQSLIATAGECPPSVCGFNGPTLTGRAEEAPEPRLVDCPENTCSGTRAAGHGLLPPPTVPIRVPPLARPDAH